METAEIRRRWLAFFEKNGHTVVPSASLIRDDPTLLFVIAGMVPFIPYFLGQEPAAVAARHQRAEVHPHPRHRGGRQDHAARHVLPDERQLLVRRLLQGGGDHATPGSCSPARRRDGGSASTPTGLWVTVYEDDDEAFAIWREVTGLPDERIQRRGKHDNYWHTGEPGPGGPCSEIYFDRGPEYGRDGGPAVDDDRYLEIWNLVFMQYELSAVRAKDDFDILGELPKQNIDTGMGLERVAFLQAGRRQHVRDRRGLPGARAGGRARRQALRGRPGYGASRTTTTCGCASSPTTCAPRSC